MAFALATRYALLMNLQEYTQKMDQRKEESKIIIINQLLWYHHSGATHAPASCCKGFSMSS
jgi:hypothetical protein